MTTQPDPRALLLAVMRSQSWEPLDAVPSIERYRRALDGSEPRLSRDEQRQLLRSPTARLHHGIARREARVAMQARWNRQGLALTGMRLAAATDDAERAEIGTADWSLLIQRLDAAEWALILDLRAPELRGTGTLELELIDETGRVWLSGAPDEQGQITGIWQHGGSPLPLLSLHQLTIRPF